VTKICAHCGLTFSVKPSRLLYRKVRFCSIPCRWAANPSLEDRFLARVEKTATCWIWRGQKSGGYGKVQLPDRDGKRFADMAHRFAYKLLVGEIPDGLHIDHLCRNTLCVNPAHLEPVTSAVNVLRGIGPGAKNAVKTHCKHGHQLSGSNLVPRKGNKGRIARECKACRRNKQIRYFKRHPEIAADRWSWKRKIWQRAVFCRDAQTCRWCGAKTGPFHAHHVKSFKDFPGLRFEVSNGLTLCRPCHEEAQGIHRVSRSNLWQA
jgi:hypothetical protein